MIQIIFEVVKFSEKISMNFHSMKQCFKFPSSKIFKSNFVKKLNSFDL